MTTLESGTHHLDVTDTFKRKIHTSIGHFDNHILNSPVAVLGIQNIGSTELTCNLKFRRVDVDRNNTPGLSHGCTDYRSQTNATKPKYRYGIAGLHFRRFGDGT